MYPRLSFLWSFLEVSLISLTSYCIGIFLLLANDKHYSFFYNNRLFLAAILEKILSIVTIKVTYFIPNPSIFERAQ